MKQTSENIISILNQDLEKQIEKFIEANKWPDHVHKEMDSKELLNSYLEIKSILKDATNNQILDKVPCNQRVNIYNQLNAFKDHVININNDTRDYFNNAVNHIQEVRKEIFQTELVSNYYSHGEYKEKLKEIQDLSNEFLSLESNIRNSGSLREKGEKELDELKKKVEKAKEAHRGASEFGTQKIKEIQSSLDKIDGYREQIKKLKDEVDSYNTNVTTNADEILKTKEKVMQFYGSIETSKSEMDNWEKRASQLESKLKILTTDNQNQKIQIDNLLQHATGTSLFHAFDRKSEKLKETLWVWLLGLIVALVALSFIGFWISSKLSEEASLGVVFWSRVLSLLPVAYLVFFFANQYSKNKNLLEEYSFKSSLSLSLEPYRDLVKKSLDESEKAKMANFLIDSVSRIYESPTINVLQHIKEDKKVIHLDTLEKILKNIKN